MSDPLPKKSLGQHWLDDAASLEAMCDSAGVSKDDLVVEIGPGLGSLTSRLVKKASQVVAIELDEKLAGGLAKRVPADNMQVMSQDILKFDFSSLPSDYKVVANIPYYLTSNLIRVLSETPNRPAVAVLLVQKEVAERVAASPGAMSLLSVSAGFYWEVSLGQVVPAQLFVPPPKVDSQILVLKRRTQPLFPNIDTKTFFRVVKAGFSARRKTLLNSLSGGLGVDKPAAQKILEAADISPSLRAQNLSLQDWHSLCVALK